jgi:hypothetical protein
MLQVLRAAERRIVYGIITLVYYRPVRFLKEERVGPANFEEMVT